MIIFSFSYNNTCIYNIYIYIYKTNHCKTCCQLLYFLCRGLKDVLKTRLKNHYKRKQLTKASIPNTFLSKPYDFFLVIDFEATCDRNIDDYPHEIIEFPAILIDMVKLVQVRSRQDNIADGVKLRFISLKLLANKMSKFTRSVTSG